MKSKQTENMVDRTPPGRGSSLAQHRNVGVPKTFKTTKASKEQKTKTTMTLESLSNFFPQPMIANAQPQQVLKVIVPSTLG